MGSSKKLPIEASILNRLGDMRFGDGARLFEVGKGAGDTEDFVVSTGAEAKLVDGGLEELDIREPQGLYLQRVRLILDSF